MRVEEYRLRLRSLDEWAPFLHRESRLPGPRGNLELLQAVVEEGRTGTFLALLERTPERAPSGTPGEFVAACGAAGLGASIARGEDALWPCLRTLASDPRWRVREGVAMALQRVGDSDMERLLEEMRIWATGGALERRAVVAGLCEPRLLATKRHVSTVLDLLDDVTRSLEREQDRRAPDVRALRKALGYGWSVAVAADPGQGKGRLERWAESPDPDVRWIVRENLKKRRLERIDSAWARELTARVT